MCEFLNYGSLMCFQESSMCAGVYSSVTSSHLSDPRVTTLTQRYKAIMPTQPPHLLPHQHCNYPKQSCSVYTLC